MPPCFWVLVVEETDDEWVKSPPPDQRVLTQRGDRATFDLQHDGWQPHPAPLPSSPLAPPPRKRRPLPSVCRRRCRRRPLSSSAPGGEAGAVTPGGTIPSAMQLLSAAGRQVEDKHRGFGRNKPNLAPLKSLQTIKKNWLSLFPDLLGRCAEWETPPPHPASPAPLEPLMSFLLERSIANFG